MQPKQKQRYEKPKLIKIKLDAKCAVLGFCKTSGKAGPGVGAGAGCNAGTPCDAPGS
jgi:hypothetical protein